MAFLSISATDQAKDLLTTHELHPESQVRSPSGEVIETKWSDLFGGSLPKSSSELGVFPLEILLYWTGSHEDGTFAGSEFDTGCDNFTNGTVAHSGEHGSSGEAGSAWDRSRLDHLSEPGAPALRLLVGPRAPSARRLRRGRVLDETACCVKYESTMWLYEFV